MQPGRLQTPREQLLINLLFKCPGPGPLPNKSTEWDPCVTQSAGQAWGIHAMETQRPVWGGQRGVGVLPGPQRGKAVCHSSWPSGTCTVPTHVSRVLSQAEVAVEVEREVGKGISTGVVPMSWKCRHRLDMEVAADVDRATELQASALV